MDRTKANDIEDAAGTDRIIAEELERLLASPLFIRSPVLSRLLQFLAEHQLRGGRGVPKAYAIATEALGRSADFDPAIDSYPRVMVGRLRSLLDRYYADTAWVHRLRVPQGSYELVVQHRISPPARVAAEEGAISEAPSAAEPSSGADVTSRRSRRWWAWGSAVLAVLLAVIAAWWWIDGGDELLGPEPLPILEVSAPTAGDTPVSRAIARALDGKLRDGLRRFDLVDLLSARQPGANVSSSPADYRLDSSIVRTTEGPVDVTLVLNRVADQRAIWSTQLRVTDDQIPEFGTLAPAIAQIAGDYGIIVRDQVQREPENFAPGYPCLAQFNRIRQMRTMANARQVEACLRASLDDRPRDATLLGALSWLRFGDWQPRRGTPEGKAAFAEARRLASEAYENAPNSAVGLFAMARAHFYAGDCQSGMAMGDAAAQLNPYDADIAGFLGLFNAACGDNAVALPLLKRSVELDPSHAGVPAVTLAFMLAQSDDVDGALALLDRMPSPTTLEPQYLMVRAIVLARKGDMAEAQRLWQQLLDYTHKPAGTQPEEVLREFMITPAVIARASGALRATGIVPTEPAE